MAHTYSNLLIHIVFSTKDRQHLISPETRSELFAYLCGLLKEKHCTILAINGVADHIHMLIAIPPTAAVSDLMKFVKANSSRWYKERFARPFEWQKGFGAFSVSRSAAEAVAQYIRDQEKHHASRDFRGEFTTLLERHDVDYEPEFLWK